MNVSRIYDEEGDQAGMKIELANRTSRSSSGIPFKKGLKFRARICSPILMLDGHAGHALLNQSKGRFNGCKPRHLIRDESSLSRLA
jgi:hypothetical protein